MQRKQQNRSWKRNVIGIFLIGAVLFGLLLASLPALHAAWHHHEEHDGAPCMVCLLISGSVELASVDVPVSQGILNPLTQCLSISGPRNLRVHDVPKYILEHAPPPVS